MLGRDEISPPPPFKILIEKPEGKGPCGRPRLRWKDSIQMILKEIGCEGMDWIYLPQYRSNGRWL